MLHFSRFPKSSDIDYVNLWWGGAEELAEKSLLPIFSGKKVCFLPVIYKKNPA